MKRVNRLMLVGAVLAVSAMFLAFARADQQPDLDLEVTVTSLNGSGVSGVATVDISDDGLRGKLKAQNLTPGHGYTVWFFYMQDGATGGPGRFDSTIAESGEVTFRGHVGGLQVSSGATVKLLIFEHPSLGTTDVTRAANLLTPVGGSAVGQAVFTIP
jgi:hypothetical protein